MTIDQRKTVLIADASSEFAVVLENEINDGHYFVTEKVNCRQRLLEMMQAEQPDIVIIDHDLSQGIETDSALALHRKFPHQKILMLSYFVNMEVFQFCIEHNINGFLLKGSTPKQLHNALNIILNGGFAMPEDEDPSVNEIPPILNHLAKKIKLSLRELQVLKYLADGDTAKQISKKLFTDEDTIKAFKESICEKVEINDIPLLISFAKKNLL